LTDLGNFREDSFLGSNQEKSTKKNKHKKLLKNLQLPNWH